MMKAIVFHDIDHITFTEHFFKDFIVLKHFIRSFLELVKNKISFKEFYFRLEDLCRNKFNNLDELLSFNESKNIPSSFFVAVNQGYGLSYSTLQASILIKRLLDMKCEVGAHGISFDTLPAIKKEQDLFKKISGLKKFGIRMHYLHKTQDTLSYLSQAGYRYDATLYDFRDPFKISGMWEFPFQIMDGWVIEQEKKWQKNSFKEAKESTKKIIDKIYKLKINYMGINSHDRYFSKSYQTWMDWYIWILEYLKKNKIKCINFNSAIKELT